MGREHTLSILILNLIANNNKPGRITRPSDSYSPESSIQHSVGQRLRALIVYRLPAKTPRAVIPSTPGNPKRRYRICLVTPNDMEDTVHCIHVRQGFFTFRIHQNSRTTSNTLIASGRFSQNREICFREILSAIKLGSVQRRTACP